MCNTGVSTGQSAPVSVLCPNMCQVRIFFNLKINSVKLFLFFSYCFIKTTTVWANGAVVGSTYSCSNCTASITGSSTAGSVTTCCSADNCNAGDGKIDFCP